MTNFLRKALVTPRVRACLVVGTWLLLILIAEVQAQTLTYTTNNGTITITGNIGTGALFGMTIPDTINGLPVTAIGDRAFWSTHLTNIVISDNVTDIGTNAFGSCGYLSSVTMSKAIVRIGDFAFFGCGSLTNLSIGNTVTSIGAFALQASGLASVTIPESVTNIGQGAFSACPKLTTISVDPNNPVFTSMAGVLFNKNQTALLQYPAGQTGTYTVPNGVTNIEDFSFNNSSFLTNVVIPNGTRRIGNSSFFYCRKLASVTIPDSVTSIGVDAFAQCEAITNLTLGQGLTSIGGGAFITCGGLTALTIPNSVTELGDAAFQNCYSLTNVSLSNGLKDIGSSSFYFCQSLTHVTIPEGVTNIGDIAFADCPLTAVYFKGEPPELGTDVFWNHGYPAGLENATVYYLPGTTGWGPTFGGLPTKLWNPQAQTADSSFGVRQNRFGFNVTGTPDIPLVIEASTDLTAKQWSALQNCTLTNGSIYFSDEQWTNYRSRFYRIRSP